MFKMVDQYILLKKKKNVYNYLEIVMFVNYLYRGKLIKNMIKKVKKKLTKIYLIFFILSEQEFFLSRVIVLMLNVNVEFNVEIVDQELNLYG